MKVKIGTPIAVVVIVGVVVLLGWLGWYYSETPYNRGLDKEAIYQAVEKRAKEHGVDLRTVPQWVGPYYEHHPEERPKTQTASAPPSMLPPGSLRPGAASGR